MEQLTKSYGDQLAVDALDFQVQKGEIVGFLGPNGAGKSTTMRILAGALGATSGRALVGGVDVAVDPRAVKRMVGYLPEFPPLYLSMTVTDYLRFCASIKGSSDASAVERVIGEVGLAEVSGRLIAHLSKGYRQRVGIASALVHSPAVLILDEPASGLDPAQRVEIRELVKNLSEGETTVILSTHVLPEVEAICDRVVMIHKGRIVADDTLDGLAARGRGVRIRVEREHDGLAEKVLAIDGVVGVTSQGEGRFEVGCSEDVRTQIAAAAVPFGLLELGALRGLEEIYLELTGGPR